MSFPPQHHPSITKERLEKALNPHYLPGADTNLTAIRYAAEVAVDSIEVAAVPGGAGERPLFRDFVPGALKDGRFAAAALGQSFGPSWTTHWLRVTATVPAAWRTADAAASSEVHFVFDSNCEAAAYTPGGVMLQGFTGGDAQTYRSNRRAELVVTPDVYVACGDVTTGTFTLFVEVACNGLFGVGEGFIGPPAPDRTINLAACKLALLDKAASGLFWDFVVLRDLCDHAGKLAPTVAERSMVVANGVLNAVDAHDRATFAPARDVASDVLRPAPAPADVGASAPAAGAAAGAATGGAGTAAPAVPARARPSLHDTVWAVGHCHIDSAWLWPYAETRRKIARSWSSQLRYMSTADTDFVFAASQVWQYAALHADHPAVFEALRAMVAAGRFVPVGGAWVEPDANMPSGESLVRQFLFGTSWASAHLGKEVAAAAADAARALGRPVPRRIPHGDGVFFLPDTFGYCPQLPQIIRGCGMRYFFTQKLSWSLVNKPKHNTFWWRALDGTEVLTHFAPADDYNCQATVESVVKSAAQNKDRGRVSHGIMLYGNGDGGGGPNLPMFEQLRRLGARPHVCRADSSTAPAVEPSGPVCETLPGMPAVLHASPRQFFDALASDASRWDVVTWSGELFLELHNGTLTSQAATKLGNRVCERLLHDVEFFATVAASTPASEFAYPADALRSIWEDVLLCQFHDVLPGSSIGMVYDDTKKLHDAAAAKLTALRDEAVAALQLEASRGDCGAAALPPATRLWNTTPFARQGVVAVPHGSGAGNELVEARIPAYGFIDVMTPSSAAAAGAAAAAPALGSFTLASLPSAPVPGSVAAWMLPRSTASSDVAPFTLAAALQQQDVIVIDNGLLRVAIGATNGHVLSILDFSASPTHPREIIDMRRASSSPTGHATASSAMQHGGNRFVLMSDAPWFWDAWDFFPYALEKACVQPAPPVTRSTIAAIGTAGAACAASLDAVPEAASAVEVTVTELHRLRCVVRVVYPRIGDKSSLVQSIVIDAGSRVIEFDTQVDWQETHKMLKVDFPVTIHATHATYETQFGVVSRPTHTNTSRDFMQHEVCGHRWGDLSAPDYGVALLNDCKYGYTCRDGRLMLSLLRSPKSPDKACDMETHRFRYGLFAHTGHVTTTDIPAVAAHFNSPVLPVSMTVGLSPVEVRRSFFSVEPLAAAAAAVSSPPAVVLDTVKFAMDGKGIILRLYEGLGHDARVVLRAHAGFASVALVNLLEEPLDRQGIAVTDGGDGDAGVSPVEDAPPAARELFGRHDALRPVATASLSADGTIDLHVPPFQVVTLRCHLRA